MEESEFIDVQGKWGKSFVEIPNPVKPGEIARFKLTPELVGNPPPEYWNKTDLREAAQMALDALIDAADSQNWEMQQNIDQHGEWYRRSVYLKGAVAKSQEAIEALRAALAQPEQEPVAYDVDGATVYIKPPIHNGKYLTGYTSPPQREWQGLTDEEIMGITGVKSSDSDWNVAIVHKWMRGIEQALKDKNNG